MFYNRHLFDPQTPLGIAWRVANSHKGVQRSQVDKVEDFGVFLRELLDNGFSLRTQSHLLLGAVKLYALKVDYLQKDCSVCLVLVRAAKQEAESAEPKMQLPLDHITHPETDLNLDILNRVPLTPLTPNVGPRTSASMLSGLCLVGGSLRASASSKHYRRAASQQQDSMPDAKRLRSACKAGVSQTATATESEEEIKVERLRAAPVVQLENQRPILPDFSGTPISRHTLPGSQPAISSRTDNSTPVKLLPEVELGLNISADNLGQPLEAASDLLDVDADDLQDLLPSPDTGEGLDDLLASQSFASHPATPHSTTCQSNSNARSQGATAPTAQHSNPCHSHSTAQHNTPANSLSTAQHATPNLAQAAAATQIGRAPAGASVSNSLSPHASLHAGNSSTPRSLHAEDDSTSHKLHAGDGSTPFRLHAEDSSTPHGPATSAPTAAGETEGEDVHCMETEASLHPITPDAQPPARALRVNPSQNQFYSPSKGQAPKRLRPNPTTSHRLPKHKAIVDESSQKVSGRDQRALVNNRQPLLRQPSKTRGLSTLKIQLNPLFATWLPSLPQESALVSDGQYGRKGDSSRPLMAGPALAAVFDHPALKEVINCAIGRAHPLALSGKRRTSPGACSGDDDDTSRLRQTRSRTAAATGMVAEVGPAAGGVAAGGMDALPDDPTQPALTRCQHQTQQPHTQEPLTPVHPALSSGTPKPQHRSAPSVCPSQPAGREGETESQPTHIPGTQPEPAGAAHSASPAAIPAFSADQPGLSHSQGQLDHNLSAGNLAARHFPAGHLSAGNLSAGHLPAGRHALSSGQAGPARSSGQNDHGTLQEAGPGLSGEAGDMSDWAGGVGEARAAMIGARPHKRPRFQWHERSYDDRSAPQAGVTSNLVSPSTDPIDPVSPTHQTPRPCTRRTPQDATHSPCSDHNDDGYFDHDDSYYASLSPQPFHRTSTQTSFGRMGEAQTNNVGQRSGDTEMVAEAPVRVAGTLSMLGWTGASEEVEVRTPLYAIKNVMLQNAPNARRFTTPTYHLISLLARLTFLLRIPSPLRPHHASLLLNNCTAVANNIPQANRANLTSQPNHTPQASGVLPSRSTPAAPAINTVPSGNTSSSGCGEVLLSMSQLLEGSSRRGAARAFFQMLVLHESGYVQLSQKAASADVHIRTSAMLGDVCREARLEVLQEAAA